MKPDWKDAPEWANWLALNNCGHWFWYKYKPKLFMNAFWIPYSDKPLRVPKDEDDTNENYRDSLEERPK